MIRAGTAFLPDVGFRCHSTQRPCYNYVDEATKLADVVYMIRPEWQGVGVGNCLQCQMIEYAKGHGVRGFTADILTDNDKMVKLDHQCKHINMTPGHGV